MVESLFDSLRIDAYAMKGRNSIPELQKAIQAVYKTDKKSLRPNAPMF